ncbi:MAG: septation protein IspZ [Alphaproteobacteria bacterium]|nr:septation protein IspZ [Alphaproteobacteria bacterium]MDE2629638.1 septation protein IspZ [Alphaproteobacteria bacterium]
MRDLLSTILFVSLFWLTNNIYWATAFGIAFGIAQTLWMRLRGRSIGPLQWVSLVLVTVFGMTTIIKHDPFYIMMKPTLVWLAVGAVMLRRDWMAPYLPPIVTDNLDDRLIVRAGYAWAALMFTLAVLNFAVAFMTTHKFLSLYAVLAPASLQFVAHMITPKFWSVYAVVTPAATQLALVTVQYFMFRKHVIERIRERAEAQAA